MYVHSTGLGLDRTMAGTALIIIAVIILIVGAFVSLHFWFHVFFVLGLSAVTSTSTLFSLVWLV